MRRNGFWNFFPSNPNKRLETNQINLTEDDDIQRIGIRNKDEDAVNLKLREQWVT